MGKDSSGGLSPNRKLLSLTDYLPGFVTYHCAMIGLDMSGKTTVLYRLKFDQYVSAAPTIGFNCEKIRYNGSTFMVWDVGGQDKLRPLWRSYTRCTDGIIFVVDSSREESLEEAKLELQNICKASPNGVAPAPGSAAAGKRASRKVIPVLVLANKQDLPSALDAAKLERCLGLRELGVKGKAWNLQPTCAVTGEGLEEAMAKLTEMIKPSSSASGSSHSKAAAGVAKSSYPGGSGLSSSGSSASTSSSSTTFSSSTSSSSSTSALPPPPLTRGVSQGVQATPPPLPPPSSSRSGH